MTYEFILSVEYNGEEHQLKANMIPWGYTHKFRVIINDTEFFFEPDKKAVTAP
ncbi:hypothetical protein BH10BAC2_BH10BAC2_36200 [soil metagenome]